MSGGVRTGEFVLFLRFIWFVLCGNQLNTPKKLDERDQPDPRHAPEMLHETVFVFDASEGAYFTNGLPVFCQSSRLITTAVV